jgi:hypothetical protein
VRKEATTDPDWTGFGDAVPYLQDPHQYGANYESQELDFIEGRASIGQFWTRVADVHQTAGDQDTGWLTDFVQDIHGYRCRVLRYVEDDAVPWVVIADGPAGAPHLLPSYAGFEHEVRDTRETERKIRAFVRAGSWGLPRGPEDGYGQWTDGTGTHYLIDPTEPLTGTFKASTEYPSIQGVDLKHYRTGWDSASQRWIIDPVIEIPEEVEALMYARITPTADPAWDEWTWPDWEILWRPAGTTDPWTVIKPGTLASAGADPRQPVAAVALIGDYALADGTLVRGATGILFRTLEDPAPAFPAVDQSVDLALRYVGEPTELMPFYLEGLTDGELLVNLYSGLYSATDEDGNIQHTGIRYVAPDVLELDEPVRLKITEPAKDLRDWAERHIYRVRGYTPALDYDGRISPVSDQPPEDDYEYDTSWLDDAVEINNAIAAPSSEWTAGEVVVNEVRFTYPRDYIDPETGEMVEREVEHTWIDRASQKLHGDQIVEIDASAYRAIGNPDGTAIDVESGARLAASRFAILAARYGSGAATITLPIMRQYTAALRAGSWVTLDLSWAPDYVTRQRGWVSQGQIVALEDLDCEWRRATIEEAYAVDVPEAPTPTGGTIDHASLVEPTNGTSEVTLNIRATATTLARTWRVFAEVHYKDGSGSPAASPIMVFSGEITSELVPVPDTISHIDSAHDWDADYVRGSGTNEVIVQMFVQIMEGASVVDQTDVSTSYYTADPMGS